MRAISGTSGSSGFGSVSNEQMLRPRGGEDVAGVSGRHKCGSCKHRMQQHDGALPARGGEVGASLAIGWQEVQIAASVEVRGARQAQSERRCQGDGTAALVEVATKYDLRMTLLVVSAGDHCALRMSRQMLPLLFTFGW